MNFLPSELSHIGKNNNLCITGVIDLRKKPTGICEGFSLLFLSYSFSTTLPSKQIRKAILNNHIKECRFLQLLQYSLWGVGGKANPVILDQWQQKSGENIPENIRKRMLQECGENVSSDQYATILEIEGICESKLNPNSSRFRRLEKDVLNELLSLYKLKVVAEKYFFGNVFDLFNALSVLGKGAYHVTLKKHAFVVRDGYCCDVNQGIHKIENAFSFAFDFGCYFSFLKNKQWITVSKIEPTKKLR